MFSSPASAQETPQQIIQSMMAAVCGDFQNTGSANSLKIEGNAEAKLSGLMKKLADLGLSGAATFNSEDYVGVLRTEVGSQLNSVRDCRLRVYGDLSPLLKEARQGGSITNTGDGNANIIGSGNTVNQ
ncbi:hypothetical protein [Kumtagia ephedrae]|jgi:hypothetical protein|uniref:Uncharacterized protein n=1 Tax=Kumtagia ephedrae TaxID=2116701 RepID=A0A2P7SF66_9HYPH|nr:hypothetical protein [Mesorhizobium ephedrae]PSJ61123.1 hypothetical protein C7I84_10535 [Mesorhizobium ephedrae]